MVCGLAAGMLIKRIRIITEDEQPDTLVNKINDSLKELEHRAQHLETKFTS